MLEFKGGILTYSSLIYFTVSSFVSSFFAYALAKAKKHSSITVMIVFVVFIFLSFSCYLI